MRHRQRRKVADTQIAWTKGQHTDSGIWEEDFVHACVTSKRRKVDPRFYPGMIVGMLNSSSEAVVVTEQGGGDQNMCGECHENS